MREVERQALDRLGHGQEIVGRLRARAFFAFLGGQPVAADGEFPLFVHNHHPFPVNQIVSCEFQPPEPNFNREVFWQPRLTDSQGRDVPLQLEKESCNIQNDHRKRVVFRATLPPSTTSRFSCRLEEVHEKVRFPISPLALLFLTRSESLTFVRPRPRIHGPPPLTCPSPPPRACSPASRSTASTTWPAPPLAAPGEGHGRPVGHEVARLSRLVGEFSLMSPARAAAFAGVSAAELAQVRVIEHGPVRTTIEALLECGRSASQSATGSRRSGPRLEVELRVAWFERDRMLKLAVPTALDAARCGCRRPTASRSRGPRGEETVGHRWLALLSPDGSRALTLVNDMTYGFDVADGEIRLSLLRAPAYAGHPVDDVTPIVRQDRFEPREDQGEHVFRFWLDAGPAHERLQAIDRESAIRTEGLMALCAFPSGDGAPPLPGVHLDDDVVRLAALKLSEDGGALVLRLFEPTGLARNTRVRIPALGLDFRSPSARSNCGRCSSISPRAP